MSHAAPWLAMVVAMAGIVSPPAFVIHRHSASPLRVSRDDRITQAVARFGNGPWVFARRGRDATPLPEAALAGRPTTTAAIELDDGRHGLLRIDQKRCGPAEGCAPPDCGCFSEDSYWISVDDPQGHTVARMHIWAAYGDFQVIPVDLVDGRGDELLIVRALGRASPPNGVDLKILKLAGKGAVEMLQSYQLAGNLAGMPVACGSWRSRVTIDEEQAKPRSVSVIHQVSIPSGCRIEDPGRADGIERRQSVLIVSGNRYVAR